MFMNLRRIHKVQIACLLTKGLVLCVVMVRWKEMDHRIVSQMRSYTYRYLINNYNFLTSSYALLEPNGHKRSIGNFRDWPPLHPYLINQPDKCAGKGQVLLLLFVKSPPGNRDRRIAIRETWGNEDYARDKLYANVKVLFMLGVHPDEQERRRLQGRLDAESSFYRDLIQQDFMDTFHNLTTKLIMQFHWASKYCPKAKFIMSADDDVFVHTPNMVQYLRGAEQSRVSNFWVGHVQRGAPPIRRKESKYHVPFELYPWPAYPDFTSGGGFVVSMDVAIKIHHAAQVLISSMYLDDVFMGICAEATGVYARDHVFFAGGVKTPHHPCIYTGMITSHGHAADMRTLWQKATDSGVEKLSKGVLSNLYCMAVKAVLLCLPRYSETYQCKAAFT